MLVHYLLTGTYQSLHERHSLQVVSPSAQFRISVHVYATARAYGIAGLVELSKERISHWARALSPLDAISLAGDACELLPGDDLWFLAFIKIHMRYLFKDPASLDHSAFLKCFHDKRAYSKVLAKSMVYICGENAVAMQSAQPQALASSGSSTEPVRTPSTESPQSIWSLDPQSYVASASEPATKPVAEDTPEPKPEREVNPT